MIVLGCFTKFGALFVTIPDPVVGGVFMVMFGKLSSNEHCFGKFRLHLIVDTSCYIEMIHAYSAYV